MHLATSCCGFQSIYRLTSSATIQVLFVKAGPKNENSRPQKKHSGFDPLKEEEESQLQILATTTQTSHSSGSTAENDTSILRTKSSNLSRVEEQVDLQQIQSYRQKHKFLLYQQAQKTGNKRFDALATTLCAILRHQATGLKLNVKSNGFIKVDDILKLKLKTRAKVPMNKHSVDEILEVVKKDPKQRYSTMVEDGDLYIRANQGHSMKAVVSEHLLTEITSAEQLPVCVHGTFKCFLQSILKFGLNRMGRNHIHFAVGLPNEEGVISGMMDTVEVLIYLDISKALKDGMKLYMSANRVVLTEGFSGTIPRDYFEKVVEWPSFEAIV